MYVYARLKRMPVAYSDYQHNYYANARNPAEYSDIYIKCSTFFEVNPGQQSHRRHRISRVLSASLKTERQLHGKCRVVGELIPGRAVQKFRSLHVQASKINAIQFQRG